MECREVRVAPSCSHPSADRSLFARVLELQAFPWWSRRPRSAENAANRIVVATNTDRSIPFNSANHRVIGGNKQKRSSQRFSPGTLGEDMAERKADGASMETGPRMYIPARIHPHSGGFLVTTQLATHSKVTPASGVAFKIHRFTSSWRATNTTTDGSQNESPPIAIQYNLLFMGRSYRFDDTGCNPRPLETDRTRARPSP